ncbi:hypothetical protein N7492_004014 [Penicillium capsulatum]|uniref:Major facilitator superfamily (MFS) profile domain-containing protein n=1 Tax=Penicillium capsulatum TaxID=69766 RepID=A0A9W9LXG7_9EURO|nr:hypothetical protein N7492_004014 [Penicillium capsulatum]KAJ6121410.1 hypothetical protein N7512_003875 [Penicillium capsulatum]
MDKNSTVSLQGPPGVEVLDWMIDAANAQNWCTAKNIYNTAIPSLLCLLMSKIKQEFHTNTSLSLLPFSLYVYGLAFGPTVSAPLSETFGQRFIYILVTPVVLLFILGAGFARNFATLAVCRLLAGIAVSAPLAVGAGTIMDLWSGISTHWGVILLMTTAFLGPALGGTVGVWIFALGAEEIYAGPIIRHRAKKLGLPIPPRPVPRGWAGLRFLATVTLARQVYMLLREPMVLLCSLYSSLNFSILFCFLASIPLIFGTTYGFTPGEAGLVLIGIAVGCILGGLALMVIDGYAVKWYRDRYTDGSTPERMLWGAMLGGPLMAVSLFWFAWTARPGIHWMSGIVATGVFGFSNILVFVSTMLYLTNVCGAQYGASALAANGLLRYLVGGSFPLLRFPGEFPTTPVMQLWKSPL